MQVSRLIRVAYGPFTVEDLAPGKIAELGREELFRFRQTLK
jgi:23S rRNA pseudouridine2605 synthase